MQWQLEQKRNKGDHFIRFFDVAKAYDSVDRTKLAISLKEVYRGRPDESLLDVQLDMLHGTKLVLDDAHEIGTGIGVPQGSSLAPLWFALYLHIAIKDVLHNRRVLAYADDLAAFFTDRGEAETFVHELEGALGQFNLRLNIKKSMLVTNRHGVKSIAGISRVNQARYLGVTFSNAVKTQVGKTLDDVRRKVKEARRIRAANLPRAARQ